MPGKKRDTITMSLRFGRKQHEKLQKIADEEALTFNEVTRRACDQYIDYWEEKQERMKKGK